MERTEEMFSQIEAYLRNQMSDADRQHFENQIQQDAGLREEVQLQKNLQKGLKVLAAKDQFRQIHQQLAEKGELMDVTPYQRKVEAEPEVIEFKPKPAVTRNRWNFIAAAASLVILLGISWYFLQTPASNGTGARPSEQLAERFLNKPVKAAPVLVSDPDLLGASNEAPQTAQDSVQLYHALGLLEKEQTRQAITELRSLTEDLQNHWDAAAQWYLVLAYLKNSQPEQARPLLHIIEQQNGHPYQVEARQLASELLKNESK